MIESRNRPNFDFLRPHFWGGVPNFCSNVVSMGPWVTLDRPSDRGDKAAKKRKERKIKKIPAKHNGRGRLGASPS